MLRAHGCRLMLLAFAVVLVARAAAQDRSGKPTLDTKKLSQIHGEPAAGAAKEGDKLQRLLTARLGVAARAYQATVTAYDRGLASTQDLIRASRRLGAAELATKSTPQERIAVLEKAVALEKEFVRLTQRMVEGGGAAAPTLENARYDLLTAEIKLLKAKAASKNPK
jgi:hypothetical protein